MVKISRLSFPFVCQLGLAGALLSQPLLASQDLSYLSFHPRPLAESVIAGNSQLEHTGSDIAAISDYSSSSLRSLDSSLAQVKQQQGPYAQELSELLLSKGLLLQGQEKHDQALKALEQGLHILRVNLGLEDIAQEPYLKAMLSSSKAQEDWPAADALQDMLLQVRLAHYGENSVEAASAYIARADWDVSLYTEARGQQSELLRNPEVLNRRLTDAYNRYTSALALLQPSGPDDAEKLIATERKLAAISFIVKEYIGNERRVAGSASGSALNSALDEQKRSHRQTSMALFNNGKSALQRAIVYSVNAEPADYGEVAERMMELGDWYLLFDRRSAAIEVYEEVLSMLNAMDADEQVVQRIFAAGLPVQVSEQVYQNSNPEEYAGYIDVEFSVSKSGKASDMQILSSIGSDRVIEKALLKTIRDSRFRPGFARGEVDSLEKMRLRYYYTL